MEPIRVLLADHNTWFLESATKFLQGCPEFEVVGRAVSEDEALEQVIQLEPDLVLMDVALPGLNGMGATRRLKAEHDGAVRVVILTLEDNAEYRAAAILAQADGLIMKSEFANELLPLLARIFSSDGSLRM